MISNLLLKLRSLNEDKFVECIVGQPFTKKELKFLQKLVDKEIPKKPNNVKEFTTFSGIGYKIAKCPYCKEENEVREYVVGNRCCACGQKLDWSEER